MALVYLLLGSNVGNREAHLRQTLELLQTEVGTVTRKSPVYETAAWGIEEQDTFLNQAVGVETSLEPLHLLETVKSIEQKVGRQRTVVWGPRVIDVDILMFHPARVFTSETLEIPHRHLHERRFALAPLHDIAPNVVHPGFELTVAKLLERCTDLLEVRIFEPAYEV